MCFGNELFFVSLYLMKYDQTPLSALIPPVIFSALPPSVQYHIARISYAQWLALISAPISLGKNIVNIVQAWKASKILVGVDLAERAKERAIQEGRKR
jgi:CDP-diacylglycerol--inositol 3-phosphatidyltransferase